MGIASGTKDDDAITMARRSGYPVATAPILATMEMDVSVSA
jgi:hypothetical protein